MEMTDYHIPYLPNRLKKLGDLAYNLWFSWHTHALYLFELLDPTLWENVYRNPVKLLHEIEPQRLDEMANDKSYLERYDRVIEAFDHYMEKKDTWFAKYYPDHTGKKIAYFSMEFGIHECLPTYSGGLGILAGDHLKSASDLGIPLVAIGLLYRESYFTQFLSLHGHQQAVYQHNEFSSMAVRPIQKSNGDNLCIEVPLNHRSVSARVWLAQIGRVPLFFLDTDFRGNPPEDRLITERLYVADRDTRLIQEILLGIGGVKLLRTLDIAPSVWHLNEGHCSFLNIERLREQLLDGIPYDQAIQNLRKTSVFTTHTPIEAGNEVFNADKINEFMSAYCDNLNISKDQCMDLAQSPIHRDPHAFNMTILALNLSEHANAVSELHGDVSRRMWHHLWPDRDQDHVPIDYITNGVHVRTWMTYAMKNLLDSHLEPDWRYKLLDRDFWEKVKDIPDEELWQTHLKLKQTLIEEIRCRLEQQLERNGDTQEMIEEARTILDPNILTIGFARRFAPYKRATLLFRNRDRLKQILWNSDHPVQIVFAGKAHPANQPGKALIQEIYNESRSPDFKGRVVFIENYDIYLARRMVSGVDVWLNTPRRPLEASGTSGMKVVANGGLNLSILDGWWSEGFDGKNGWAISENKTMYDEFEQDEADSQSLYHLLENEIVPLYYAKDNNNIPSGWTEKMKTSMASIIPRFNTDRMLKEYMEKMYSKSLI